MMRSSLKGQRLAALFFLGLVLFNYPVVSLSAGAATLFGIPVLYLYVFFVWALLIAVMALIIERSSE